MSIEVALRQLNIDYKTYGNEAQAKCPFHYAGTKDDSKPSWYINLKSGVHHCFSCGFAGNLAYLVSVMLKCSYPEAVIWCNEKVGWAKADQWREDYKSRSFTPRKLIVNEASLALFTDPPDEMLRLKGVTRQAINEYEVRWDKERSRWIFPVRDPYNNDLWGWQLKNDRYFRSYPGGLEKSKTLFGLRTFKHGEPIILVESPIDCVRLLSAGIRGGLSSLGVSLSNQQQSIIHGSTEHLILALDNDFAGVEETARICTEFRQLTSIRVFSYGLSSAKDPGEMTDEEIQNGIRNAKPSLIWLHEYEKKNADHRTERLSKRAGKQISGKRQSVSSSFNGLRQNFDRFSSRRKAVKFG